jgi:hypothetical protein
MFSFTLKTLYPRRKVSRLASPKEAQRNDGTGLEDLDSPNRKSNVDSLIVQAVTSSYIIIK